MKKKLFILLLSATMSSLTTVCKADAEKIDVSVNIDNVGKDQPVHRSPMKMPNIYINDYTLSFVNLWGGASFASPSR